MPIIDYKNKREWNKEFLQKQYEYFLEYKQFYEKKLRENKQKIKVVEKKIIQLKEQEGNMHQISAPEMAAEYEDEKIQTLLKEKDSLVQQNKELQKRTEFNEESKIFFSNVISVLENASYMEREDKIAIGLEQLEIQEAERKRIARDLHDSTIQNLTSLMHKIEWCMNIMEQDSIRAKLELQTINQNLHTTISEMRELIYNLRPMSVDDLGIDETIVRFLGRIEETSGLKVTYHVEGICPDLKPVILLSVFRVIQEGCKNVVKHASAKHIYVDTIYTQTEFEIAIRDDGLGFDVKQWMQRNEKNQFGLSMMYERVFLLNGEMTIQSTKNKGTVLRIKIPVSKEICND